MKRKIILKSPAQFSEAVKALDAIPKDEVHELAIYPHKSNISVQQRAYYWVALGVIAEHTGELKNELHLDYKKRFLVDIFTADEDNHPGYGEMMEALRDVWRKGHTGHAKRFYDFVVEKTSIMDATVENMTEYIDSLLKDAAQRLSCYVTPPDNGLTDEHYRR